MRWLMLIIPIIGLATDYSRDFLDPGFGARALGMGSAFVAIADDASGFYWNPANMVGVKCVGLMHAEDYNGIVKYDYASLILAEDRSTFGFALYNIRVDGIKFTELPDSNNEVGPNNRPVVKSNEMSLDYVLYLNHAQNRGNYSWGGNLKVIYRDLIVIKGYGIGCDLGLLFRKGSSRIGIAIKDIILSPIYYSSKRWEHLSPLFAAGFATNIPFFGPGRLTPSVEFNKYFDEDPLSYKTRIGIEYEFKDMLAIRTGLKDVLFSLGLGIRYKRLFFDYAFLPGHSLGSSHKISGSVIF